MISAGYRSKQLERELLVRVVVVVRRHSFGQVAGAALYNSAVSVHTQQIYMLYHIYTPGSLKVDF